MADMPGFGPSQMYMPHVPSMDREVQMDVDRQEQSGAYRTRYDHPEAGDGYGGPHPLAGVPQAALDAAALTLEQATLEHAGCTVLDGEVRPVAEAVLAAALEVMRATSENGDYTTSGGAE